MDDSMRGGKGILSRFLLLLGNEAPSSTVAAARQVAGSFPDILELRLTGDQGLALVRPDGYIAYSTPDGDDIAALGSVRSLLERQTN
jgi:hypothetical protein